jgi:biopolymer transport protein ExbB/TolQ
MLALQAMRAAYSGIQYCCDCLREGTVEIQKVKKTVEGGVADAKKIYAEVTGIWGWLQGLFKFTKPDDKFTKPAASTPTQAKPVAKEIAHIPDENEIVQQFIGHVGEWFDNYHTLKEHADKRYAEVFSKDVIDQKEVLELTQLQVELDAAYPALMTQMTTNAPWQLGPIWSQFKEMQDKVKVGQAARKMRQQRERAQKVAAAAQRRSDQIDRNMTWFWSIMLVSYFWVLMGTVWLSMTTTQ